MSARIAFDSVGSVAAELDHLVALLIYPPEDLPRGAEMKGANAAQALWLWGGIRARYSSPPGFSVQSLPGKAAPPWNSEGTPLTIGVDSTPGRQPAGLTLSR